MLRDLYNLNHQVTAVRPNNWGLHFNNFDKLDAVIAYSVELVYLVTSKGVAYDHGCCLPIPRWSGHHC